METNYLKKRIGIVGGGQLGKMMILEAKKMGFYTIILDPAENCPAHSISDEHIIADFKDSEKIKLLASKSDVVTYEIEHIAADTLLEIERGGKEVYPTPKSLLTIQDKYTQKKVLKDNNIPVPGFINVTSTSDIFGYAEKNCYPIILKARTGGYDGRGNAVIKSGEDVIPAFELLGGGKIPLMAEKFIDFKMETSILVCRGIDSEIKVYPAGNNIHRDNILVETIVPAGIGKETSERAMEIAKKVMEVFEGVGMFCIEMFITGDGGVFVNEIAPRPHNSGHYTIEGCVTSQFEQHIRAITGLPLGDAALIRPSVMVNLLGEPPYSGTAFYSGLNEVLKLRGLSLHIYGKGDTKPKRKMGHFTVTAETVEEAKKIAYIAKEKIKVVSEGEQI